MYTILFSDGKTLTYYNTLICLATLLISAILTFSIGACLLYSQIELANHQTLIVILKFNNQLFHR